MLNGTGSPISGIEEAEGLGALVFHAGTALRDDQLVTNGGRILNVTAVARTIAEARALVTSRMPSLDVATPVTQRSHALSAR